MKNVESEIIIRDRMIDLCNLVCKRFNFVEILLNGLVFSFKECELFFKLHVYIALVRDLLACKVFNFCHASFEVLEVEMKGVIVEPEMALGISLSCLAQ